MAKKVKATKEKQLKVVNAKIDQDKELIKAWKKYGISESKIAKREAKLAKREAKKTEIESE